MKEKLLWLYRWRDRYPTSNGGMEWNREGFTLGQESFQNSYK